jgi:hypothetical protein
MSRVREKMLIAKLLLMVGGADESRAGRRSI